MLTQGLLSMWTNQPSAASSVFPATPTDAGATVAKVSKTGHPAAYPRFCANHLALQRPPRDSSRANTDVQAAAMDNISVLPVMSCKREENAGKQSETLEASDGPQKVQFMRSTGTTFTNPPPQKRQRICPSSSSKTPSSSPLEPSLIMEHFEESLNATREDTSVVNRNESVIPGPFQCSNPTSDTSSPKIAPETPANNHAAADALERQNFGLLGRIPSELPDQV